MEDRLKMGKKQLLDMISEKDKEIDELRRRLKDVEQELAERRVRIENAGSIAEATADLNGIFAAAQDTADQYLENIREMKEEQEAECKARDEESRLKAAQLLEESVEKCRVLEEETAAKCRDMVEAARNESRSYWRRVSEKLEEFSREHEELRELLTWHNGHFENM